MARAAGRARRSERARAGARRGRREAGRSRASLENEALAEVGAGYSKASYYASLGLFALSLPGLWSLVKRSTKSKVAQKTYELKGPADGGEEQGQIAQRVAHYFTEKNYAPVELGEVATFEGNVAPQQGIAAYITFCAFMGLLSLALVLNIAVPGPGSLWYAVTLLSPLAGVYYQQKADRRERIKVKLETADDDSVTDLTVEGDDEEIDRFRRELALQEKGKIPVKGLLEQQ
jgi:hypothetical protein